MTKVHHNDVAEDAIASPIICDTFFLQL